MRPAVPLLTIAMVMSSLTLALGQANKPNEQLYDQLLPDLAKKEIKAGAEDEEPKTGDVVQILAVDEEYIGPLPEQIPTTFFKELIFAMDESSGSVAYCYNFHHPEQLFKAGDSMRSKGRDDSVRVIHDGIPSPAYRLALAPRFHGDVLTYAALDSEGFRAFRNGMPGNVSFESVKAWAAEKFGHRRMGYIVKQNDSEPPIWQMLSEDRLGPEFQGIERIDHSTDHLLLYVAVQLDGQGEVQQKRVVVDQQPEPWHRNLFHLTTSPDGRRYAYIVVNETEKGDVWRVVIDGEAAPDYDGITSDSLRFSPNGKRYAYAGGRGDKRFVVVDGKEFPAFQGVLGKSIVFSQDSQHFAYAANQTGPDWAVLVDGKSVAVHPSSKIERVFFSPKGNPYFVVEKIRKAGSIPSTQYLATPGQKENHEFHEVRDPVFSSDGNQVAYIGVMNDATGKQSSAVVVHNGKHGKEYRWVRDVKFSADGKRLFYFAKAEGRTQLVVNGEEREEFDFAQSLVLSPDGKHWAARGWRGEEGQERDVVVVDGKVVGDLPADLFFYANSEVAPEFSPDGQHCAYFTKDQDRHFLVIDGHTTHPYDRFVLSEPKFLSPTRVRFYAVKNNALLRVHADIRKGSFKNEPVVTEDQVAEWIRKGQESEADEPLVAAAYYRKAAERGDAEMQCDLGKLYSHRKLTVKNPDQVALHWFRKAANSGHPRAQFNLGVVHEYGQGVEKNDVEALRWYHRAGENGYPSAQVKLGLRYRDGTGVKKDLAQSLRWYQQAAEQEHLGGLFGVAYAYDSGLGVKPDYQRALRRYRQAAAKGHLASMDNIGNIYHHSRGVPQNLTAAKYWYRQAARLGSDFSRKRLQNLLPNSKSRRDMSPWFARPRTALTRFGFVPDGRELFAREIKIEAPAAGRDTDWSVTIPLYVYSPEEIDAVTDENGRAHADRLPEIGLDRFRPLSWSDRSLLQAVGDFLPIAYPPYGVQVSGLDEAPPGAAESIQRYLETFYENGGR